jgi:ubiquinone biosynthesis protein UbiJ
MSEVWPLALGQEALAARIAALEKLAERIAALEREVYPRPQSGGMNLFSAAEQVCARVVALEREVAALAARLAALEEE